MFDRSLRREARWYRRGVMIEIGELNSSNTNAFWEQIKKIRRGKKNMPIDINEEDGNIKRSSVEVLEKWELVQRSK